MNRASGILLPIFSLPNDLCIGNFSKSAYEFIDFLKESHQKYWQVLPLNSIGSGNSPYFSESLFSGNQFFIDLESLVKEKLLDDKDLDIFRNNNIKNRVNYNILYENFPIVLRKAYNNFKNNKINLLKLNIFRLKFGRYLNDYVSFKTLSHFLGDNFLNWEKTYKYYNKNYVNKFLSKYKDEFLYNYFIQYKSYSQWFRLKKYANENGIKIIGDLPIYSSNNSSDVWANSKNYILNENLEPSLLAGCPPDSFDDKGQLWGNPLYDYQYMKNNKYKFLLNKFKFMFKLYDVLRLDHFRGYESFYAIDSKTKEATNGKWIKGPGNQLFDMINKKLKNPKIIAEDLGYITDEVKNMLNYTKYPGMKVMEFAFSHTDNQDNPYRPHNYIENSVAYLGTHDNDTFMGWYNTICAEDKYIVDNYLHLNDNEEKNITTLKVLYNSKSNLVITNIQDVLGIGSEGRINTPSTLSDDNWSFRFLYEQLFNDNNKKILKKLTADSKR